MDVLFSKYSNDRADAFSIRTDILQDSAGERYVRKCATTRQAQAHISHIYDCYLNLRDRYDGVLEVNRGELRDGEVWLEYLKGITLEDYLEDLVRENQKEKVLELLSDYRERVLHSEEKAAFAVTDRFREIFGEVAFAAEQKTAGFTDIDMVLANIVICDGKWTLVDYEWSFDFPIPEKYVLYRTAEYLYANIQNYHLIEFGELMDVFAISPAEKTVFWTMERRFQLYIQENTTPLRDMQDALGTNILPVHELLDRGAIETQVFYDYGDGFKEETSEKKTIYDNIVSFEIWYDARLKQIRLDPVDRSCFLIIHKLEENDRDRSSEIITNARGYKNRLWYFEGNDPQIILTPENKGGVIRAVFYVIPVVKEAEDTIHEYFEQNKEELQTLQEQNDALHIKVDGLEGRIDRLEALVAVSQSRVAMYENSRKIKLLKKLKILRM